MIHTVLFDWDGTLVNSKRAIMQTYRDVTSEVMGREYPTTPEEVSLIMPMRLSESVGIISPDPEVARELAARFTAAYLRNSELLAEAFPGTIETLQSLRSRGITLGVVTSKGRGRMQADAERYGLVEFFDVVVTGDDSKERKPHPGPIIDALEVLGVTGDQVIYVGDGPQDVIAGKGAGTFTVSCSYGFHGPEECLAENPDFLIDEISELTGVVGQLLGDARSASGAAG